MLRDLPKFCAAGKLMARLKSECNAVFPIVLTHKIKTRLVRTNFSKTFKYYLMPPVYQVLGIP